VKYLIALVLGVLTGVAAALMLVIHNPTAGTKSLSPLSVSSQSLMQFRYTAVSERAIAFTNDGESATQPYPSKILQLWESTVRDTDVLISPLRDARDQLIGFGIKYSSDSEASNVLRGEALQHSVWHIVLPGRGSLFIEQSENYWNYITDVILPAHWSAADSWKGIWTGNMTSGPGALGLARVVGGAGEFSNRTAVAVESLTAEAYSTRRGPVAVDGVLLIEIDDNNRQAGVADSTLN